MRGSLLKAGHFSMVWEGEDGIMTRFAGLKVEEAGAACREFQEELLMVSERLAGNSVETNGNGSTQGKQTLAPNGP